MIAIIGAGISGLSLAFFLEKLGKDYVLLEKEEHAGGVIQTEKENGTIFDLGPNSLLVNKDVDELIDGLELQNDVIEASSISQQRYIIEDVKLKLLPKKPQKIVFGSLLSFRSKFRVLKELLGSYDKSVSAEESVEAFFCRHFGQEIVDKFVFAFVNGIYNANPSELSIKAVFPKLLELERKYGSIIKALIKEGIGERVKTVNFRHGMRQLTNTLVSQLKSIQYNVNNIQIVEESEKYKVDYVQNNVKVEIDIDKVVFCVGSNVASQLLESILSKSEREIIEAIKYSSIKSTSVVTSNDDRNLIRGFGALGTKRSGIDASGVIATHQAFPYKVNENSSLFNVMQKQEQTSSPKTVLENLFNKSLDVQFQKRKDWFNALPVYDEKVVACTEILETLATKNLLVNSNWHGGLSVRDCISKSKKISTFL